MWSGQRAVQIGLVDHVGGLWRAIQLAKREAGLAADEAVRVLEVSKAQVGAQPGEVGGVGGRQRGRRRGGLRRPPRVLQAW